MALWAAVAVVLARGVGDILAGTGERAPAARSGAAERWPGRAAEAFAVGFAGEYLTWPRADRALASLAAPELRDSLMSAPAGGRRDRQGVAATEVAGIARLSRDRALITVACTLKGDRGVRYLVVPVARDAAGGLVVFELPSFAAPVPVASVIRETPAPLSGSSAAELRRLAERFLRAYLSGDGDALTFLVARGARITPASGIELRTLIDVGQLEPATSRRRTLVARASVRDTTSRTIFAQAFRLTVERRERWYVSAVAGGAS